MSDTITEAPPEKVTRRDLAEGKIEKILSDRTASVPVSPDIAGLGYQNFLHMAEAGKVMATFGPLLPPWLQGNVGGCTGIIVKANDFRLSPLALAEWSFVMERNGVQRLGFVSAFFRAIVDMHAGLKERLRYRIVGEGDERRCEVWGTFKGESEPRIHIGETLGHLRPKKNDRGQIMGSPLWERKPELQLFYDASRDWARANCAEIIGGMYTREELIDAGYEEHTGSANAKDVTPTSSLKLRLGADKPQRAADLREHVNAALDKQQFAADAGNASSADETAPTGLTTVGAEGAGASTSPPDPNASAPTTSLAATEGGPTQEEIPPGSAGSVTRPADPTDHELRDAFDKGVKDRAAGKKRSNVPAEWREGAPKLAFEWVKGFNSVK